MKKLYFLLRNTPIAFALMLMVGMANFGCNNSSHVPDVSSINVTIESRRLDKDLLAIDTNRIVQSLVSLREKYPDFLDFYIDTLLGFGVDGNYTDTNKAITEGFRGFVSHGDYRGLLDTIQVHFPDVKKVDEELKKSFQYLKYYFPAAAIPKVVYFSSGLNNWGAITVGNIQGIGLDMYLGKHYPYYKSVGLSEYLYQKFTPDYIPIAAMSTQYELLAPFNINERNLLDLMIQRGKLYYFLEKVVPFRQEHLRVGYTEQQLAWCKDNEREVYGFFIQQKLLYETNLQKIMRYVLDGPTSTGMPQESPGNIGSWIGYRIVQQYMQKHPELSLKDLVLMRKDAEAFLRESGYKP